MTTGERQSMMNSMMEQFFGGMSADEKKDMCATMMGMMAGKCGDGADKMPDMMSEMMHGCDEQHMPEMMLTMMMPHCIGMLLPAIDPDKRGDVGATLLTAIVEKGSAGMSDRQKRAFLRQLATTLNPQP